MEIRDPEAVFICQRLVAPHDKNGNPRRVWVLYSCKDNEIRRCETKNEEYYGKPEGWGWPHTIQLPDVHVTAAEYRMFLSEAPIQ